MYNKFLQSGSLTCFSAPSALAQACVGHCVPIKLSGGLACLDPGPEEISQHFQSSLMESCTQYKQSIIVHFYLCVSSLDPKTVPQTS